MDTIIHHIPSKMVECKKPLPPWLTSEVRKAIQLRDKARQRAKKSGSTKAWTKYRQLRNKVVTAIRISKHSYFTSLTKSVNDPHDFWKAYNHLTNSNNKIPSTLSHEGRSVTSPSEKAEMLNNFFSSCFSTSSPPLVPPTTVSTVATASNSQNTLLSQLSCSDMDVLQAISTMKSCTATGPDEISATMLKKCSHAICSHLACIFNASFSSGKVPHDWKVSRITPVFKR